MEKRIIPIALLVLGLSSMLFFADNIDIVYAQVITSAEPYPVQPAISPSATGYHSATDKLLMVGITGGVYHVYVVAGNGLTALQDIATTLTTIGGADNIVCNVAYCYFLGQSNGGSNTPTAIRINMQTYATTTYAETDYNGCTITTFGLSGNNLYATMADLGGCGYTGIYQLSTTFDTKSVGVIQWIDYDTTTVFGDTSTNSACVVSGNYLVIRSSANLVQKYVLSTKTLTSSSALGSAPSDISCDSTHVYLTRQSANVVNRVRISNLAIEADSATITAPTQLMVRGDSVYVARSAAATITVLDKTALGNSFVFFTAGHNDVGFFLGNATRFNIVAPTANDNIVYQVDGIFAEELEEQEEEENNQTDGVCGVGTALECVGDRGTIGNIFYGTGGTSQPITNVTNNLLNGLGITNTTNTDIQTNGTGLFLMLLTGVFFFIASVASVAVANAKFNANIQYSDSAMNAYWLLFLVIAVVAISYYLAWIPDIIFYGLIVGLAGLFAFGAYRHFKSGG